MGDCSLFQMEWSEVSAASGYEIQMSSLGGQWVTIAPCFGSTLLRKKGRRMLKRLFVTLHFINLNNVRGFHSTRGR